MLHSKGYEPNVLIVGDVEEFHARLGSDRSVNVIGHVKLEGTLDNRKFNFIEDHVLAINDRIVDMQELSAAAARGDFDYIIFLDHDQFILCGRNIMLANGVANSQIMMYEFFERNIFDRFYSWQNEVLLFIRILKREKVRSLFDADGFLLDGQMYVKPHGLEHLTVDSLNTARYNYPLNINLCDRIYDSLSDCRLRHYDAVLLTAERDRHELRAVLDRLRDMGDAFIIFVRRSSNAKDILVEGDEFDEIKTVEAENGAWFCAKVHRQKELAVWVVAHKSFSPPPLDETYRIIHAGRALGTDLGYEGDDTGDNISDLNPYLNELTALYWIWKNTSHDVIGIAHYRRFFLNAHGVKGTVENIINGEQITDLIGGCDIIVGTEKNPASAINCTQRDLIGEDVRRSIDRAIDVVKEMIEVHQPHSLNAFEHVMKGSALFRCSMMIARKHVFDEYCRWLFSFMLPATEEMYEELKRLPRSERRVLGYIGERMLTVWLLENHVKVSTLPIAMFK